jgi:signal transduction histidine kinase/ligand-binding sensor domain-containing protein
MTIDLSDRQHHRDCCRAWHYRNKTLLLKQSARQRSGILHQALPGVYGRGRRASRGWGWSVALPLVFGRGASLRTARYLLFLSMFFFSSVSSIAALDPARRISQYAHTAWRTQDDVVEVGTTITQTTDGYLWLGTRNGLLRFDGVKFVPYDSPGLPGPGYNYLLGARDGSLWIGTRNGIGRLKDGRFQWYSDPAQHSGITAIVEDHEGTIWFTRYHVPRGEGPLCRVEGNGIHCYGQADGIPVKYGLGLTEDSTGNLWFGSSVLCRWRPGSASTYLNDRAKRLAAGDGVMDVAAGPSGTIWAATEVIGPDMGVLYFNGEKWASYVVSGFDGARVGSESLFMDRNNSLWIGTNNDGLYRIHDGVADHYGPTDGLSGKNVSLIYEDREGNVWVVTDGGLDMFRDTPVVSYSAREGLSGSSILAVLGLQDGSLWIGNGGSVDILKGEHHSVLSANEGLKGQQVSALFQDHDGAVWLGLDKKLLVYEGGRFGEVRRPNASSLDDSRVSAITEDVSQNIWVLTEHHRLFRIKERIPEYVLTVSGDTRGAGFLAPDHDGGIWIASRGDTLTHYRDGNSQTLSLNRPGGSFTVWDMIVDSDDSLFVATSDGLFRWDKQHWQILDSRNGLPANSVFAMLRDNDGDLWLYSQRGLVRIARSEVEKWRRREEGKLTVEVFDRFDGTRPGPSSVPVQPIATKTLDGRLWFATRVEAQAIDPKQLFRNHIPPPVHVEKVIADRKDYGLGDGIRLPALTRDIQIDYTALSVAVPQKVSFRYQLEGHDAAWQEAGTRREAFYSSLPSGRYRFHVIASNNDGVWNEEGAWLDLSVAPAWYQRSLVRLLFALIGALLVWGLYRMHIHQLEHQSELRLEARVSERTRIARELHDTLLQSFHGLMFQFQAARNMLPRRPDEAMEVLDSAIGATEQALSESRSAIQQLRSEQVDEGGLARWLNNIGQELGRSPNSNGDSPVFRLTVEGEQQSLSPLPQTEVCRITREILQNAFRHAKAHRIEAEIRYDDQLLRVRIRDDGTGIDPQVLQAGGSAGHWGLRGARERAQQIGARLDFWSEAGVGTEVQLTVPASIAYEKSSQTKRRFRLFRKGQD